MNKIDQMNEDIGDLRDSLFTRFASHGGHKKRPPRRKHRHVTLAKLGWDPKMARLFKKERQK